MVVSHNKMLIIVDYSSDPALHTKYYDKHKHNIHKCNRRKDNE